MKAWAQNVNLQKKYRNISNKIGIMVFYSYGIKFEVFGQKRFQLLKNLSKLKEFLASGDGEEFELKGGNSWIKISGSTLELNFSNDETWWFTLFVSMFTCISWKLLSRWKQMNEWMEMTSASEHERSSKLFVIVQWSRISAYIMFCIHFNTLTHSFFASYSDGKTTE